MSLPQPVEWRVRAEHALAAIEWACKKLNYSIDRPNMNPRGLSESLDDKVMGDVATVAVVEYLRYELKVPAVAYDQVRNDNFQSPDPGWDVAIGPTAYVWAKTTDDAASLTDDPATPIGLMTASVRSSRLPRADTLAKAVQTRDFKIFAPPNSSIEDCITADVEMQVYYDYHRTQLGPRKILPAHVQQCIQDRSSCQQIMQALEIQERYSLCYLTAWNFKTAIVQHSRTLSEPCWESYGKRMWLAPLRLGRDVRELQWNSSSTPIRTSNFGQSRP
jgi:hypothetical protein